MSAASVALLARPADRVTSTGDSFHQASLCGGAASDCPTQRGSRFRVKRDRFAQFQTMDIHDYDTLRAIIQAVLAARARAAGDLMLAEMHSLSSSFAVSRIVQRPGPPRAGAADF